jgi:putative SOS response-associated peptidase YedK
MCGRYVLSVDPGTLQQSLGLTEVPDFQPHFNIAPTQLNPVITSDASDKAQMLRWGLIPSWSKDKKIASSLINARAESVADKPSFRGAYKKRRCLVPATGYYEWQERDTGGGIPTYIYLPDQPVFTMAGIWETWRDPDTSLWVRTYSLITTDANAYMSQFHHRMPVIIRAEDRALWVNDADADDATAALLRPYDGELLAHVVSRAVNRPANDSPELIEPIAS